MWLDLLTPNLKTLISSLISSCESVRICLHDSSSSSHLSLRSGMGSILCSFFLTTVRLSDWFSADCGSLILLSTCGHSPVFWQSMQTKNPAGRRGFSVAKVLLQFKVRKRVISARTCCFIDEDYTFLFVATIRTIGFQAHETVFEIAFIIFQHFLHPRDGKKIHRALSHLGQIDRRRTRIASRRIRTRT